MWARYLLICLVFYLLYSFWIKINEIEYRIMLQDEVTYYMCSKQIEQSKFNQNILNSLRKFGILPRLKKDINEEKEDYSKTVMRYKHKRGIVQ
jgi:hypothetical protein